MLGNIDRNKKPIQPQYFLAKPNREIISKLSEAFNDNISMDLNGVGELNLSLPYKLDKHHSLKTNKNIELIRERYLINTVTGNKSEWYIIHNIEDSLDNSDMLNVSCYSLEYELNNTLIKSYSVESYGADKVMIDILANTLWNIDYIDADFKLSKRAFEFTSTNALAAIVDIADKYNAILKFDSESRLISMTKPELTGINMGLTFGYGKLMKSMNVHSNAEDMVTRLYAYGKDGLGIQKVNPTGQNYIENFGYWMYPFQRDANKSVISSSHYMTDSLCHALLDYEALIESKTGLFKQYLDSLELYERELNELKVDLNKLQNDEKVIQEVKVTQQFGDKMFFEKYSHSGSTSRTFKLNKGYNYAAMIKVDSSSGLTVALNGSVKSVTSGRWVMLGKLNNLDTTTITVNGSSTGVFMQVATISIEEYQMAGNDNAIVERYSLDNKENQINLKQIEISNKLNQITNVQSQISNLKNILDSDNNFTDEQLTELKDYVIEKEFSDDVYIDEKDLYEAAQEKFKELQIPELSVEVDIVNFLEIIEEQRNWKKLNLGDFINIKYEPLGKALTARIIGINFDFSGSSIKLTLSNAKNVNDEANLIEKLMRDYKNTSVIVDTSKTKWGQAVVDSSDMSRLFENVWNKVTNQINMSINNTVELNNQGITISDDEDPLRFLRLTHGQIGLTRSGGLRFETAIDASGVIAEMLYGKVILGQRVVIADTTGVFTIEGSKLMIDDRCGRPVLRLGLTSELPDVFGMHVNRYASSNCNDKTITNVSGIDNGRGFYIDKIRNGVTTNVFGLSQEGDLRLRVGDNNELMLLTSEGLSLGGNTWASSPTRFDFLGNAWLNSLFADRAVIKNSKFGNGEIDESSLTLRDGDGIFRIFPKVGMWGGKISEGAEDFDKGNFSVDMYGNLKAHNAKFYGKAGELLIDTDAGVIDLDKFDMINVGKLMAEMLEVNTILADDGYVNNLTVNRLKTIGKDAEEGQFIDYIDIEGNKIQFITAQVSAKEQAKDSRNRLLFWQDSEKRILTTENTGIIAYSYTLPKDKMKIKREITFEGSGDAAQPVEKIGTGDGGANDRAKMVNTKYNGGYKQEYKASNNARERSIDFKDTGIYVNSEGGAFTAQSKDFQFIATEGGSYKLGLANGSIFELSSTGLKIDVQGNIEMKATGNITRTAGGNIKDQATRIDLN
ncbi:phage tail protein [Paenibacillus sp. O199]|uniref:phage tail protein n=1 Tax=Paenibacillus sp. O199 TaxID=1643925 RepID=UPI0007BF97F2|nr:phage tail protein [Paenibacillus sp. O199]